VGEKQMPEKIDPRIVEISARFYDFSFVYLYLIMGEKNILIDTGIHSSPEKDILSALKSHGLTLSDIDLILNTHDHPDHTGGNAAVKTASGAQIYIHKEEIPFLNDHEHAFEVYTAPVIRAMGGNLQAAKQASLEMAGPIVPSDQALADGDVIDGGPGIKLRVVHLPGHTLGSVGFFWEEEGILFSGDSVGGLHDAGAGGKLPIVFDLSAYKESLQRLQKMDIRFLLCAHRYKALRLPPAPVRQGQEVSQFVKDSLEFTERLDEAIQKVYSHPVGKSFMELADEVVSQFPEEMGFKPLKEVERPHLSAHTIYFRLSKIGQKVS
jgi:glyoxylase-like metal-dependent hydrolase (beta-lactamase superfamily II)